MSTECLSLARSAPYRLLNDELPEAIRLELNAERDRDLLIRMRYLARKKIMRQPNITEEELADYLALAENFENFPQWLSSRRGQLPSARGRACGWIALTAAVIGVLTAILIVGIAISV